ncbi:MAG: hypothetical protein HYS08_04970 [Chlamydiae bacterium]|nr:hypothetical protein [Chlamydiota bacterium]MBI3267103.1 hypothetical protein [Chlamydiota bacterium]
MSSQSSSSAPHSTETPASGQTKIPVIQPPQAKKPALNLKPAYQNVDWHAVSTQNASAQKITSQESSKTSSSKTPQTKKTQTNSKTTQQAVSTGKTSSTKTSSATLLKPAPLQYNPNLKNIKWVSANTLSVASAQKQKTSSTNTNVDTATTASATTKK